MVQKASPSPASGSTTNPYAFAGLKDETTLLGAGATKLFAVIESGSPYEMTRYSQRDALFVTNRIRNFLIVAAAEATDPGGNPPDLTPRFPSASGGSPLSIGDRFGMSSPSTPENFQNQNATTKFIYDNVTTNQPITLLAQGLVILEEYSYVWQHWQQPFDQAV